MRVFLSCIVLLGLTSETVFALTPNSLEHNGQFRVRNDHKHLGFSTSDKENQFQMRARLNLDIKTEDNVRFRFTPQATKNYGEVIATANDESNSSRDSSGDKYHSAIEIFEAYTQGKKGSIEYTIGRQTLAYGDNIILGTRNWTAGGLSHDAIKISFGKLDIAYSLQSEGDSAGKSNDDKILSFLYYKAISRPEQNLDLYLIHNNERGILETLSAGIRYKQKFEKFDFRTENIIQRHAQTERNEHNIDLEIGYHWSPVTRVYISGSQASDNYDHLYTNRHRYNGILDVVGRQNLEKVEIGFHYKLNSESKLRLELMSFSQKTTGVGAYSQSTSSTLAGNTEEKKIGDEIDLLYDYKLSKSEKITFAASYFQNGDYFNNDIENSSFTYLQYLVKF